MHILTAIDIAAIRAADVCVVRYYAPALASEFTDGATFTKRAPLPSPRVPFPQELAHAIPAPVTLRGFDRGADYSRARAVFVVHLYPRSAPGILHSLRVGDAIAFTVTASNNNGYLDAAGLHCDELSIRIRRGKLEFTASVDRTTCPDNSARAVQVPGRPVEYSLCEAPDNV